MPRARGIRELRAIFGRLGRVKPVRRIAIAGAVAGGLYGLHRVRRAYKKRQEIKKHKSVLSRIQKIRDADLSERQKRVEAYRKLGLSPNRKLTAKQRRQEDEEARARIRANLDKRFPTRQEALKARYPHLFKDPVIPKVTDSKAQQDVLSNRAESYLGESDAIEKEFGVRRVRPRTEHTADVVSRMRRRDIRRDDY